MVQHGSPRDPKFTDEPESIDPWKLDTDDDTEGHFLSPTDDQGIKDQPGLSARTADEDTTEGPTHR